MKKAKKVFNKKKNLNKKKLIICIFILFIVILIFTCFFYKIMSKNLKSGNNMSNQEVEEYFINISSYEAKITVEVNSNKNSNKYILNQKYISPNKNSQEVIEPSNIAGVKIIKEDNTVKLENTNLNLTSIFENYDYISDNCLDLSTFISDYKASEKSSCTESENQIILKTQSSNNNKYTKNKTLYIDKETMLPLKMEIRDYNQKSTINIIYNEVKINK